MSNAMQAIFRFVRANFACAAFALKPIGILGGAILYLLISISVPPLGVLLLILVYQQIEPAVRRIWPHDLAFILRVYRRIRAAVCNIWPHDSGFAWTVIGFPALVAILNTIGILYGILGLGDSFYDTPILTLTAVLIWVAGLSLFTDGLQQVKELIVWGVVTYDRIVSVAFSFIYGLFELLPKPLARLLGISISLGGCAFASFEWAHYILRKGAEPRKIQGVAEHLLMTLVWFAGLLIVLTFFLVLRRYRDVRAKFGGDTIPRLDAFEPLVSSGAGAATRVAHLSDLHIPWQDRLTEDGHWDDRVLENCVAQLVLENAKSPLTAIVFSGDITDTGHEEAWRKFIQQFDAFKDRIVLAPGNHDLNIVGYGVPSIFLVSDEKHAAGRWKRMKAFMDSSVALMGNRAQVWRDGVLDPLPNAWAMLENNATLHGTQRLQAAFDLFPLVVTVPQGGATCVFLVWNTVRTSMLALNNSYGNIGDKPLDNFKRISKLLEETGQPQPIHVMHHKLGLPVKKLQKGKPEESQCIIGILWAGLRHVAQLAGMTMTNAQKVAFQIMKDDYTVVLHGHHHATFTGQLKKADKVMHVISAPSTTLGAEYFVDQRRPPSGFDLLTLAPTSSGWALAQLPEQINTDRNCL